MPKLKTHRGAAKRFRKRANGGIKCRNPFRNHGFTKKTKKSKRQRRGPMGINPSDVLSVERMLQGS